MRLALKHYVKCLGYVALSIGTLFCFQLLFTPLAHASISNGANALDELGEYDGTSLTDPQPIFTKGTFSNRNDSPNPLGFNTPYSTALDTAHHRFFVVDSTNNRVLVYNLATDNTFSDRVADNVLGQANFTSTAGTASQAGLSNPFGIAYDSTNDRLFVSQISPNRITVYDVASITNGENAVNVLGQANFTSSGSGITQAGLSSPYNIAYDSANSRLFVADSGNHRIIVYNVASITDGESAVNVLGQANFTSNTATTTQSGMNNPRGVAYDGTNNRLFVSQIGNHRITIYDVASITDGESAVNVLGQANFTSSGGITSQAGLFSPYGMAYDSTGSLLFISDSGNNRVIVYDIASITDGESAVNVLGQANFVSSGFNITQSTFFSFNGGVTHDTSTNRLFVADAGNHRIMIFDVASITNGENAVDGLGQYDGASLTNPQLTYTKSGLNDSPNRLGFDDPQTSLLDSVHHRLFVADSANNRVLIYNLNTNNTLPDRIPDNVLGQTSFSTKTTATTQAGMSAPYGLAYDSVNDRLFVSQTGNHRITIYDVASITNGENAVNVLGQANFTSGSSAITQAGLNTPRALNYDSTNNRLFVADSGNNRVIVYDIASITDGESAVNVLGQANFTSNTATTTQSGMNNPRGVAYDGTNNRLFVGQATSNRVAVYDVTTITDGESAVNVLGQANFTSSSAATTATTMNSPYGVTYDNNSHRLFVADGGNQRLTVFDVTTIVNGESAINVLGPSSLTIFSQGTTQARLNNPVSSVYDSTNNRLLVADTGNERIMIFDAAATGTPLAYPAGTPLLSSPTTSTLALTFSTSNNTSDTTYAIFNSTLGTYVAANGASNGSTPVYFTTTSWTGTVTGLTPNTSYQFSVIARNTDGINAATSSVSTAISTLALSPTPTVSNPTTSTLSLFLVTENNPTSTAYAIYNSPNGTYLAADGSSNGSTPIFFTSSSWGGTVTGLSLNTSYQFSVIARNGDGINSTSSLSTIIYTLANPALAPLVSNPTTSSLQLSLTTNSNPSSTTYAIYNNTDNTYVAANGSSNGSTPIFFTSSSWNGSVTGLSSNTSYQFSSIAQNGSGINSATSSLSLATSTLALSATTPGTPTISSPTTSTLQLTINTTSNSASTTYAIYNNTDNTYVATDGSSNGSIAVFFPSSSWSGTVNNLNLNTSYQFSVVARSVDNIFSPTSSLSSALFTLANPALAPTFSNPTTSTLSLTINTNGNPASTTYAIYTSTDNVFLAANGSDTSTTAVFFSSAAWNGTVNGLSLNTSYQFSVISRNGDGIHSATSSLSLATSTLAGAAFVPGAPTVYNPTTSSLQITLDTNGNDASATYALYNSVTGEYLTTSGTGNSAAVFFSSSTWNNGLAVGLNLDTAYQFEALAKSSSNIISATSSPSTLIFTLATTPGAPLISHPTTSTLELSILTNSNPTSTRYALYNITDATYLSSYGIASGTIPIFFTSSSWNGIVTGLSPNTNYQFNVTARNGDGIHSTTSSLSNVLLTLSVSSSSVAVPLVSNPTISTLQLLIDTTGQSSSTTFAVLNVSSQNYFSSTGTTVSTTPIFFTADAWNGVVRDLQINTPYQFQIITSDNATSSISSPVYTLSSIPYDLTSPALTRSTISLAWSGQGSSFAVNNDTLHTVSSWSTDPSFIATALDCASSYTFRVKSRNGDGVESLPSNPLMLATAACSDAISLVGIPGIPINSSGFFIPTPPLPVASNNVSTTNFNEKDIPVFPAPGSSFPITFPLDQVENNGLLTALYRTSSIKFIVLPSKDTLRTKEKLIYTYQFKNPGALRRLVRVLREVRNEKGKLLVQERGYRTLAPAQVFSFSPRTGLPPSTPRGTYTVFVKIYTENGKLIDQNGFKFKIIP